MQRATAPTVGSGARADTGTAAAMWSSWNIPSWPLPAPRQACLMVLLALLAGCTMLPTIVPDMAPSRRVQLEGARGPLTAKQSQAILARLKSSGKETSIFDRHLALEEEIAGSPLVVGNKVALLQDGPDTYRAMFNAIRRAHDHINLETYISVRGCTGSMPRSWDRSCLAIICMRCSCTACPRCW